MKVQVVALPGNYFCLVDLSDNWQEGLAVNLKKREIVYYNGDYGESRPKEIKRLIADPDELGWVSIQDKSGNLTTINIMDAQALVLKTIIKHDGMCVLEDKKIQGKLIITLPI